MIKLINILKEGAYDSMTRKIVTDIMREWKDQYMDEQGDLEFENDYELTDAKGRPFEFELNAILKVEETEEGTYAVDGGVNQKLDPPYLEIRFQVDPRDLPQMWETIYYDLTDVIRHELEHFTQEGTNAIFSKEMADDIKIRRQINKGKLPRAEYFKLEREVDAMLQGLYIKAKKTRTPFKTVINDYFDKVGLDPQERQDILNVWSTRLRALNLPPIQ
jgi:hypothetical protein